MITIYQVIKVVFWFYNLSITFASVVVCMHANWSWSQALHIISLTWKLTPPHRGGFCNYILSCQPLLLAVCHVPYVSHRDIIVVLISGPKPSGPEPMEIWEKRLVNNVPTIWYWTTVTEYLNEWIYFLSFHTYTFWHKQHKLWWRSGYDAGPAIIRLRVRVPSLLCRHLGIGSLNHNWVPDMTRWLCMELVHCAKIWLHVLYAPRGVDVCWYETGRSRGNNVKRPWTSH